MPAKAGRRRDDESGTAQGEERADRTPRCLHLIPTFGIGGVETAALSLENGQRGSVTIEVIALASGNDPARSHGRRTFGGQLRSVRTFWDAIRYIARARPDVLVCSLWPSLLVGIAVKLRRPQTKLVVFAHSAGLKHRIDALVFRLALRLANALWTDSRATLEARQSMIPLGLRRRVISFRTAMPPRSDDEPEFRNSAGFIVWSRINASKGFVEAVEVVDRLRAYDDEVSYDIYGPDDGFGDALRQAVRARSLQHIVRLHPAIDQDQITHLAMRETFFLLLSEREGAGMAVMEAMALGLIPVVTAVGDIANYCNDGENALVFDGDIDRLVERLRFLMADDVARQRMSDAARATWRDVPEYREDFARACHELLELHYKS
ncbi:MAG: glycosyltransferase family 4 protein [Pseudomonadota bacterium]